MACKVVIRGQDECVPLSALPVGAYFEHRGVAYVKLGPCDDTGACRVKLVSQYDDDWQGCVGVTLVYRLRLVHAEFERVVTE